jgi:hypothetical protein
VAGVVIILVLAFDFALIALAVYFHKRFWRFVKRLVRRIRMHGVFAAVREGDLARVHRKVGRNGRRVNAQDLRGDAALHAAYYYSGHHSGKSEMAEELLALGAHDNLFSDDGLRPVQMVDVRQAEDELVELGRLVDAEDGRGWRDSSRAREIYERLRERGSAVVSRAVGNAVAGVSEAERWGLFVVGIKLGDVVRESVLRELLGKFGTQRIAEDFLHSGSPLLRQAAEYWERAPHRAKIARGEAAAGRVRWGEF